MEYYAIMDVERRTLIEDGKLYEQRSEAVSTMNDYFGGEGESLTLEVVTVTGGARSSDYPDVE